MIEYIKEMISKPKYLWSILDTFILCVLTIISLLTITFIAMGIRWIILAIKDKLSKRKRMNK